MNRRSSFFAKLLQYLKKFSVILFGILQNKVVRNIVALIILVFCAVYIINHLQQYKNVVVIADINFLEIALSTSYIFLAVFTGSIAWYFILISAALPISFWDAIKIHLYSNISKYIPGVGWQYISKFYQMGKFKINNKVIVSVMAIELILIIASGIATFIVQFPWELSTSTIILLKVSILVLLFLLPLFFRIPIFNRVFKFQVKPIPILLSLGILLINWNLLGLSMWHLAKAFGSPEILDKNIYTSVLALSFIVGIIVIPVPSGIGVREGMLMFLLSKFSTSISGGYLAGISRLQIITSELILAGIIWILSHWTQDNTNALLKE